MLRKIPLLLSILLVSSSVSSEKIPEVIIASIDSGTSNLIDYKNSIWTNTNEIPDNGIDDDNNGYIDDIHGWNFIDNSNVVQSGNTYTHGDISIKKLQDHLINNSCYQHEFIKNVKIMPINIGNGNSHNDITLLTDSIEYAVGNGADIINLPFEIFKTKLTYNLIETLHKKYSKTIFVISAGNLNDNIDLNDSLFAYTSYDNIYLVGACNILGKKQPYSNYGKYSVDFFVDMQYLNGVFIGKPLKISGTSFSIPAVSACIAIIKTLRPNLKPESIKNIIINNLDRTSNLSEYCRYSGVLNITSVLSEILGTDSAILKQLKTRNEFYYLARERFKEYEIQKDSKKIE